MYRLLDHAAVVAVLVALPACARSTTATANDVEALREPIEAQEGKVAGEAEARKRRSIAILQREGVRFFEHLPVIETEAESTRRSMEEVAARAVALAIVAAKGEGMQQTGVEELTDRLAARSHLSPNEREFLRELRPGEQTRAQFLWRYEAYWVLLWALGYVDQLERPDKVCDVKKAVRLLATRGKDRFRAEAKLRSQAELLDAVDLIYRYHWALVDARRAGRPAPTGLSEDIVMERHHALNWLVGYMNQEWDDVTTDT